MGKKFTKLRAIPTLEKQLTFSGKQLHTLLECIQWELDSFTPEDFEDTEHAGEHLAHLRGIEKALLPGVWMELYRSVTDDDGDFEECRNYTFKKREIYAFIEQELRDARAAGYLKVGLPGSVKKVRVKDIPKLARKFKWEDEPEFLEFDSSNPTHGCGYWELRVIGPEWIMEALNDYAESI